MDGIGSVILNNADMNDNGLYEFTYNRDLLHLIQVDVLIPYEVSVTAGETAPLPCHAVTSGESVQSFLWEKDGESVLQLPSGDISYGTDFNGSRVSVSSDWHRRGDLTLTVKEAEPKDEGVYYCSLNKRSSRGNPAVVRLRVGDIIPGPRDSTPPPPPPPPLPPASSLCPLWIAITVVVTSLIVAPSAAVFVWRLKDRRCPEACKHHDRRGSDDEESLNTKEQQEEKELITKRRNVDCVDNEGD
ncbi:matrix remodeling-associated protein 8-like isoform X2 [Embiotoca jacksoni]